MPAQEQIKQNLAEKELFSWRAPARPFKKRDREFWVSVMAIAAVSGFIFYIIEGIMPVLLIVSLVFLLYVLSTVEPEEIGYKITNKGVRIADKRNNWEILTRFWFSERLGSNLLVFEMLTLPGRLEVVINAKDEDSIRKAVLNHLPEEEAPPTNLDRAANWFSQKLPGNKQFI